MAILRVKDGQGQWQEISAIVGATGPTGPQGPTGMAGVPITVDTITTTTTWSGNGPYSQTVTMAEYTPTAATMVSIQPDATAIAQMVTDGVVAMYVSNNAGTLTLYAVGAAPTVAMTLQVTATEVSQA